MNLNILYSDKDILVVEKPAGIAVQTRKLTEKDLVSEIKNHLSQKNKKTNPYLGIIHRLDQPVRGILVFALNEKAAAALSEQLRSGNFNKYYYALAEGIVDGSEGWNVLTDRLIKDKDNIAKVAGDDDKNAKRAELKYRVVKTDKEAGMTKLEIELITGRFHQIRAQLSNMGHPIINDRKYGACKELPQNGERSIALCSYKLSFKHPVTGILMEYGIDEDFSQFMSM